MSPPEATSFLTEAVNLIRMAGAKHGGLISPSKSSMTGVGVVGSRAGAGGGLYISFQRLFHRLIHLECCMISADRMFTLYYNIPHYVKSQYSSISTCTYSLPFRLTV